MLPRAQGLKNLLQQEVRAKAPHAHFQRCIYFHVIHTVMRESDLLNPGYYTGPDSHAKLAAIVQALARIAIRCNRKVRAIEGWNLDVSNQDNHGQSAPGSQPRGNLNDQFDSLVNHLFAKYPVPRFMNKVWFEGGDGIEVFLKMGQGIGPRQCGLPIRLTKAQAREFMQAPDDLNIWQAIRWSQVRSLGGSKKLARLILKTRLNERQDEESFWIEVIEFLCKAEKAGLSDECNSPALWDEEVAQVVQFVLEQRFWPAHRVLGYRFGNQLPMQPDFSLKRRTLRWFRRHQVNWRNEVELPDCETLKRERNGVWSPIGLSGMRVELENETWSIEELLTAQQLEVEGGIMKHCVGGYVSYCIDGVSSIWSMRITREEKSKRVLTIEVNPRSRRVVQAKGKRNAEPSIEAYRMLKRWAAQQNLACRF